MTLHLRDGGAIPGVSISGAVLLEINMFVNPSHLSDGIFGDTNPINTFKTKGGTGDDALEIVTDGDGDFVFEDVTIAAGLHLLIQGRLKVGPIEIAGRLDFTFTPPPDFSISLAINGKIDLGPLGSIELEDSGFRIDRDGFAMSIIVNLDAGGSFGRSVGLGFTAHGLLELNTASTTKSVGSTTVPPGFRLHRRLGRVPRPGVGDRLDRRLGAQRQLRAGLRRRR